jgi:hypothetical protein
MTTITVRFLASRSSLLPWMLERARLGRYEAILIEGRAAHQTVFVLPCEDAVRAAAIELAQLLKHHKGFAWVNGQAIDPLRLAAVLRCYGQSLLVSDVRGHCWIPRGMLLFPCREASGWAMHLRASHPASLRAQTEAVLVQRSCHWCPSLRLDQWELECGEGDISEP